MFRDSGKFLDETEKNCIHDMEHMRTHFSFSPSASLVFFWLIPLVSAIATVGGTTLLELTKNYVK